MNNLNDNPLSAEHLIYNQQNQGIGAATGLRRKKPAQQVTREQTEERVYQLTRKSSQVLFSTKTVSRSIFSLTRSS